MQASETKLQPLIEGTKQYVVPLFQRSYSWDRKEWEVLWKDLIELYEMENPRTHFMGSIVTMPAISVPEGVTKFQLIDGQQRLTTIFILLTLLRDKARELGESPLADEINNTLLVNPYKSGTDSYKLLPTQADRAAFYALIQHDKMLAESRITEAYLYFDRQFKQKQPDIRSLNRIISSTLSAVSIVLDADDNPYLVFESLNAKGKPLSQADLIRNYVFMRVHIDEQQAIHEKYWKPMQDALADNLTEYIRHYLMRGGEVVRQNDVYFALKSSVGTGDVLDKLRDIAQFAKYYHKMLTPAAESDDDIGSALARLNRIEVTTAYPLLLNCYDDYEAARISREEFLQILAVIENFMIRRFVCNIPTMGLNRMFAALYSQVSQRSGPGFVANLRGVLQARGYPKDDEFRQQLISAKLYGVGERATKTRLILETMERSFGHKEQVPFGNLSIEHVMPQTLTEWWQHHLGSEWEMTRELYLHTIGNLTLTAYNPELSNDDYPTKRARLEMSHLELNRYFANVATWTKDDIERRSHVLADAAVGIWPYFGDSQSQPSDPINVTGTTPTGLSILGQHFSVQTWRDVLEQTMNTIAELEPEKFEQITQQFPRLVGSDQKKFRAIRELKNGFFVEMHLSAKAIQSYCIQAIESIELSAEDWQVTAA
ncbi:MAG: DUF262 domain-containing protein [Gemmatimonadaceae bacterium]